MDCKGPVTFNGHVVGRITGCSRRNDEYLYLDMELYDGLHPVYSSDGEVWLRDEPDNEVAYRLAQEMKSTATVGLSVEWDDTGPVGAEAFLTPAVPKE